MSTPERSIAGWIDDQGHPVVQITLVGLPDPLTVLVDTGFNQTFLISSSQAREAGLALDPDQKLPAILADGSAAEFLWTCATIYWFGQPQEVSVYSKSAGRTRSEVQTEDRDQAPSGPPFGN